MIRRSWGILWPTYRVPAGGISQPLPDHRSRSGLCKVWTPLCLPGIEVTWRARRPVYWLLVSIPKSLKKIWSGDHHPRFFEKVGIIIPDFSTKKNCLKNVWNSQPEHDVAPCGIQASGEVKPPRPQVLSQKKILIEAKMASLAKMFLCTFSVFQSQNVDLVDEFPIILVLKLCQFIHTLGLAD